MTTSVLLGWWILLLLESMKWAGRVLYSYMLVITKMRDLACSHHHIPNNITFPNITFTGYLRTDSGEAELSLNSCKAFGASKKSWVAGPPGGFPIDMAMIAIYQLGHDTYNSFCPHLWTCESQVGQLFIKRFWVLSYLWEQSVSLQTTATTHHCFIQATWSKER